ncbi:MAG: TIM barrel protein [Proteobacteria bacterium]|nr:TIM barrel protein [Pseudomonadota bacterium]
MPKFSANLWYLFQDLEMMDRIDAAAAVGFRGVEYNFPYQWPASELAERLAEHGLQQVQINAPPGDWDLGDRGLAGLPGREEEFRDSIEQAIGYAKALNCPLVHVMAGVVADGAGVDAAMETLADNLNSAAAACEKEGIGVLVEALNPTDVPGYLIGDTAKALSVIGAAGHNNLFLQYDLYHGAINGDDLLATISDNLGRIRHIQVAGVPGRGEPDGQEGGGIDYPALFNAIDGLGYAGWIGCEYRPRAGTVEGLGWAREYGIG